MTVFNQILNLILDTWTLYLFQKNNRSKFKEPLHIFFIETAIFFKVIAKILRRWVKIFIVILF